MCLNYYPVELKVMKKIFIVILAVFAQCNLLSAQDSMTVAVPKKSFHVIEIGARLMPTFSSFDARTSSGGTVSGEVTLGYGIGGFLGINFSNHVGIQGELIYSSITQKYKEKDLERKVNLQYFNIPVLLSLNTNKSKPVNLNLVVGPQIGISQGSRLSSSGSGDSTTSLAVLSVKKGDLGFAYGAGLDFGLNEKQTFRLGIGFRGVYGLLDISDDSQTMGNSSYLLLDKTHVKTYSAYFGVSYLF